MKIKGINIIIHVTITFVMALIEIAVRNLTEGYVLLILRDFIAALIISVLLLNLFTYIVYKKGYRLWLGLLIVSVLTGLFILIIGLVVIYIQGSTLKLSIQLIIMICIGSLVSFFSFLSIHYRKLKYEKLLNNFKKLH